MFKIVLIVGLLLMAFTINAKPLVLVEFETESYDSTLALISKIEELGGTVRHIFIPNAAIVDIHKLPIDFFRKDSSDYRILSEPEDAIPPISSREKSVRDAFFI